MEREETGTDEEPCCKIGRLVRRYGLEGFEEELERRWTDSDDHSSLRELQRTVNRRVLRAALSDSGAPPLDGEAENYRRILTDSNVPEDRQIEACRRLENEGIDVEDVRSNFVSHQTVYNHLRSCRGIESTDGKSNEERFSETKSRIFGLQNRTEIVTEQALSTLGSHDLLSPDEYDVVVDIQAVCESCGRSHDVALLLENGGCSCGP